MQRKQPNKFRYYLVFQHLKDERWADLKHFEGNASYFPNDLKRFTSYENEIKNINSIIKIVKRQVLLVDSKSEHTSVEENFEGIIKQPSTGAISYLLIFQEKRGIIWGDLKYFPCTSNKIPIDFKGFAKFKKTLKKYPYTTRYVRRLISGQEKKPFEHSSVYYTIIQEKIKDGWNDLSFYICKNSQFEIVDKESFEDELKELQSLNKEIRVIK